VSGDEIAALYLYDEALLGKLKLYGPTNPNTLATLTSMNNLAVRLEAGEESKIFVGIADAV